MMPARSRRAVHGIVLLDKPAGITSNGALQQVRRLFNAAKGGHTGNLDSPATGLLPICLGEATKVTPYLLDADKEYLARIRFGSKTTTADATGEVVETRPVPELSGPLVDDVLARFHGNIEQVPPMYSALKVDGERLYRLAAQGVSVERRARPVHIAEIERLSLDATELAIRVRCSKGTYIRTLAEDIGVALGTVAHVLTLRRTEVYPFRIEQARTIEALSVIAAEGMASLDACLLPMDQALPHLPAVSLLPDAAWYLCQGQAVRAAGLPAPGSLARLYDPNGDFLGLGESTGDGRIAPRRLIVREALPR
jgi:tRNA pseudouridine55 synthase